jgi:hypothetical protein
VSRSKMSMEDSLAAGSATMGYRENNAPTRTRMKLERRGRSSFGIKRGVKEEWREKEKGNGYHWVVVGYTGARVRHPFKMRPLKCPVSVGNGAEVHTLANWLSENSQYP